jgi:hypothetical protein
MEVWLTTFRCSENPNHLLYVEEAVAGPLATSTEDDPIGCLWGDDGTMERLPSEFELTATGKIRVAAPMEPIPPAA